MLTEPPEVVVRMPEHYRLGGDASVTVVYHHDEGLMQLLQWGDDLNSVTFPIARLAEVRAAIDQVERAAVAATAGLIRTR